MAEAKPAAFSFPRSHRLSGKIAFAQVYETKQKIVRGPLAVFYRANELGHARLGLSVPRRVGTAPVRNRVKRLLRDAFRLHPQHLPTGFDLVIAVRPHAPMPLVKYQQLFAEVLEQLARREASRFP